MSARDGAGTSTGRVVGLDGIEACTTAISSIDGDQGELRYRGYDIRDLVERATFPDVAQLLWLGDWPSPEERRQFDATSRQRYVLPPAVQAVLDVAPRWADPLAVLRTAISIEGVVDPDAGSRTSEAVRDHAATVFGRTSTIVGMLAQTARGATPTLPRRDLDRGSNVLWMATGIEPDEVARSALDALLITYAEHELNPSTFAGRIVAGTQADYWSALTAAIGAFKGPLHGGAFIGAIALLREVGSVEAVEGYLDRQLAGGAALYGFGKHHVYRSGDPRVAGMRHHARQLAVARGGDPLVDIATEMERQMLALAEVPASADLYGSLVMHLLGFPPGLFSSLLVCARFAGWTAHIGEHYVDGEVLRPRAAYVGPGPQVLSEPVAGPD